MVSRSSWHVHSISGSMYNHSTQSMISICFMHYNGWETHASLVCNSLKFKTVWSTWYWIGNIMSVSVTVYASNFSLATHNPHSILMDTLPIYMSVRPVKVPNSVGSVPISWLLLNSLRPTSWRVKTKTCFQKNVIRPICLGCAVYF